MDKIVLAGVKITLQRMIADTVAVLEFDRELLLPIVLKDTKGSMCNLQSKCFLVMRGLRYFWIW